MTNQIVLQNLCSNNTLKYHLLVQEKTFFPLPIRLMECKTVIYIETGRTFLLSSSHFRPVLRLMRQTELNLYPTFVSICCMPSKQQILLSPNLPAKP